MSIRLPHALPLIIVCSIVAAPLLGEAITGKGRKPLEDESTREATSAASRRKQSAPTPTRKKSSPAPKASTDPDESPEPTLRATPKASPPATPTPVPTPATPTPAPKPKYAPNATLQPEELLEYAQQPERVKALIADALELTRENLTYTYGSADPANGGMDCSGTIYYVLRKTGFPDVPRDSPGQYAWTRKAGTFRAVVSRSSDSFEFDELLPGDLMFWTGTYQVDREIPVTHVMIYLGTERKTKRRVMFGASDGRSYAGQPRWGVSVFDFQMPRARQENPERRGATFVGYGRVPGLRDSSHAAVNAESDRPRQSAEEKAVQPTPKPKQTSNTTKKKSTPKPAGKDGAE